MAICQVGRVDPSPPEAHGSQALQVRPLWTKFLQIRSLGLAHETAPVNQTLECRKPRKVIKKMLFCLDFKRKQQKRKKNEFISIQNGRQNQTQTNNMLVSVGCDSLISDSKCVCVYVFKWIEKQGKKSVFHFSIQNKAKSFFEVCRLFFVDYNTFKSYLRNRFILFRSFLWMEGRKEKIWLRCKNEDMNKTNNGRRRRWKKKLKQKLNCFVRLWYLES